ncbi:hypothetical protein E4U49_004701 [Claviceps purpurea]|nr:hypothetical protein E4U49_004701 [Claviceps purpurea]
MGFPPKPRTDWLLTVPFPGPGGNTGTTGSEQRPERPKLQQKTAKSQGLKTRPPATPRHAMPSTPYSFQCRLRSRLVTDRPSGPLAPSGCRTRASKPPQSPRAYDTPGVHVQRKKGLGRIVEPPVENGLAAGRLTADGSRPTTGRPTECGPEGNPPATGCWCWLFGEFVVFIRN